MWKSDKNNINIGPDVRLKKMRCFLFFRKFVPVPHNGFYIIVKNYSEFWLFFPMWDETRELPYHNKQAWLHPDRLNFTQQGSPHIVKTGRLDFSLSWLEGEVRENLGDFRKSIKILTLLSPLPHVPLPFTKTNNDLKRMQLTSLE